MTGWLPHRRGEEAIEWMDAGRGTAREVAQAYDQLETVNRLLSGYRATFEAIEELLPRGDAPLGILDVAGGAGDFGARLAQAARARGRRPMAWVLDVNPLALSAARRWSEAGVRPIRGDALALPFPDRSLDLVHCATFFHHLSTARARDALAEMCRVSRRLVVVNDLVRSWVAAGAIWGLSRAFSDNRLIRHDGPLSVLKAFLPREVLALARAVGVEAPAYRWQLTRVFPYRFALVGVRCAGATDGETPRRGVPDP
ncbi:MAG TPA: methyltransferase domain-containing protein [Gemmatimonadota bacterium]|nr:methyltransferase domain-containing protein [Gemmatimonadota bacterium]